jgi:hypothetical protein
MYKLLCLLTTGSALWQVLAMACMREMLDRHLACLLLIVHTADVAYTGLVMMILVVTCDDKCCS